MIAEDDAVSRLILQRAIEKAHHEVVPTADGLEAWACFQEEVFDVVISDWMMPGIDGMELCRRIRDYGQEQGSYTYFIMATALGEREHFLAGMGEGADDYLTKPLDRMELLVRLIVGERIMSLYRQLQEKQEQLDRLTERQS